MLLSQHALIRGAHSLLMISWPWQPVPAPASFLCCLPGISEQRRALCVLLLHLLVKCLTACLSALQLLVPSLSVCLSVSGGLSSAVWQTPGGVRALLSPEPTAHHPQGSIWPLSPAESHLALFLELLIQERFAREAFFCCSDDAAAWWGSGREVSEHVILSLGLKQKLFVCSRMGRLLDFTSWEMGKTGAVWGAAPHTFFKLSSLK